LKNKNVEKQTTKS